jgi:hypothetical protein
MPTFHRARFRSITENGKLAAYRFVRSEGTDGEELAITVPADGKKVTVGDEGNE